MLERGMKMHESLTYRSVKELSQLIASKELSPVDLLEDNISQIEKRNEDTNAFVFLEFEGRVTAKLDSTVFHK